MRKAAGSLLAYGFLTALGLVLRRAAADQRALALQPAPQAPFDSPSRAATPRPGRTEIEPPDLSDDELVARVLAQVEIPADVEVFAEDGAVVVFGRVPRYLARGLIERVSAVEGVTIVQDRLTPVDFVQPERASGSPGRT